MTDHYFTPKPTSKKEFTQLSVRINKIPFDFETVSGLFSLSRLDKGTEVLLKYAQIPQEGSLLDLGCGWGPVAVYAKKINPHLEVTATDVNFRAVEQTLSNAKKNNVQIKVYASDGYKKVDSKFDIILFNPPQTAGKKLCMDMIADAKKFLNKGGSLQIVARTQKGGKSFAKHMEEVFGNVQIIGRGAGYSIYKSNV